MRGYEGFQGGHKRIQEVTGSYRWLKGATSGYRVTGNYRLVLFISKLFSKILDFIYKTFSIFLFFLKSKIDKILSSQLW